MDNQVKIKIAIPKYQQIAADIAARVADGKYSVGDKIYARSSLASQYGVSAETARRAVCVLSDLNIVSTEKGSGVVISSYENAVKFLKQYQDITTINDIKSSMLQSVKRQKKEMELLNNYLTELIEKTEHFRSAHPFMPFQIIVTAETPLVNQSIADIRFWQNTAATIVAIKRKEEIFISPGPYAVLLENDIIYFVGTEDCLERVKNFLYSPIDRITD